MSSTIVELLPTATSALIDALDSDDGDAEEVATNCFSGGGADTYFGLRVASIFIILVGSTCGTLFPVLARRSSWLHVPKGVFEYVVILS